MIYPLPAVMVTCGATEEEYNIITIAWTGTICTNPPMCYISVRPERHSAEILRRNMEFVINLTDASTAYATDWCGVRSGKDYNKFKEMGLTPGKATIVQAPIIEESPLCIECRVKEIVSLGSHDMFIADVLNVKADEKFMNAETGKWIKVKSNEFVDTMGTIVETHYVVDWFKVDIADSLVFLLDNVLTEDILKELERRQISPEIMNQFAVERKAAKFKTDHLEVIKAAVTIHNYCESTAEARENDCRSCFLYNQLKASCGVNWSEKDLDENILELCKDGTII